MKVVHVCARERVGKLVWARDGLDVCLELLASKCVSDPCALLQKERPLLRKRMLCCSTSCLVSEGHSRGVEDTVPNGPSLGPLAWSWWLLRVCLKPAIPCLLLVVWDRTTCIQDLYRVIYTS